MRRNPLLKKLKGFQKAPRARFIFLTRKQLTHAELILYELGVAVTDWDDEHIDTYGSFEATNAELSEILGWKSDTTAGRYIKSLITKKIFCVREDGRIEVKGFEKWQLRKTAKILETDAENKKENAELQNKDAEIEEKQLQYGTHSLGSFKDNLSSSGVSEDLSDDELDLIGKEIFGAEAKEETE